MLFLLWQAGQVYDVPLSGSQLTKPGVFPELRPCGEDFRKKWIEVCLLVFFNTYTLKADNIFVFVAIWLSASITISWKM